MKKDKERELRAEARRHLLQVAYELEVASKAAKEAATHIENRDLAWSYVQQLYARGDSAQYAMTQLKKAVDDAIADD